MIRGNTYGMTLYSSREVCRIVGITYRQLDYWLRVGIIGIVDEHTPGSGHGRRFTEEEVLALVEVVSIVNSARAILADFGSGELWASTIGKEKVHGG